MNHQLLFNMGSEYLTRGDFPRALDSFNESIKVKPDFGPAYLNIFDIMKKKGDLPQALQAYNAFMDCPLTGRTFELLPKLKAEAEELQKKCQPKPPEKK